MPPSPSDADTEPREQIGLASYPETHGPKPEGHGRRGPGRDGRRRVEGTRKDRGHAFGVAATAGRDGAAAVGVLTVSCRLRADKTKMGHLSSGFPAVLTVMSVCTVPHRATREPRWPRPAAIGDVSDKGKTVKTGSLFAGRYVYLLSCPL